MERFIFLKKKLPLTRQNSHHLCRCHQDRNQHLLFLPGKLWQMLRIQSAFPHDKYHPCLQFKRQTNGYLCFLVPQVHRYNFSSTI